MAKKKAAVPEAEKNQIAVRSEGAYNSSGQGESTAQRKRINAISRQRNLVDDDTFGQAERIYISFGEATKIGNIGDPIEYKVNAITGAGPFSIRPTLKSFLFYAFLRDANGNVILETDQGSGGITVENPGAVTSDIVIKFDSTLTADGINMLADEELVVAYLTPKAIPVKP
jgi:hypothetical protein